MHIGLRLAKEKVWFAQLHILFHASKEARSPNKEATRIHFYLPHCELNYALASTYYSGAEVTRKKGKFTPMLFWLQRQRLCKMRFLRP